MLVVRPNLNKPIGPVQKGYKFFTITILTRYPTELIYSFWHPYNMLRAARWAIWQHKNIYYCA
ncbi:hypothetical protein Hanom_Chr12g01105021 [Helianthus anomalus]